MPLILRARRRAACMVGPRAGTRSRRAGHNCAGVTDVVHVAVVGAGIIGVTLADALVRRGASVTVLDADQPGSGTSGSSLAWLNANQKLPRHYHDLSVR